VSTEVAGLRNGKPPRSAAALPLGILFAVLGIAGAVVIWLSLTPEIANDDGAGRGPKAVVELALDPAAKGPTGDRKPAGTGAKDGAAAQPDAGPRASVALMPPPRPAPTKPAPAEPAPAEPAPAEPTPAQPARVPPKPEDAKRPQATPPPVQTQTSPQPEPRPDVAGDAKSQAKTTPVRNIVQEILPGQLKLPVIRARQPLAAAPAPGLVQTSGLGPLPMIGTDGRQPWRIYARPFDKSNKKPRIAMVVTGLGLSSAATNIAIQSLPGSITLAFAPYADRLGEWIRLARAAGHEVLLNVPMEPVNYPEYDPGPQALLISLSSEQNVERLLWTLSRATGYIGVVDFMGSRFTASRRQLRPILNMLKKRGLMFLDSNTAARSQAPALALDIGTPFAANTGFIDESASRGAIDRKLKALELVAKKRKLAIGMGSPYPVTLERINNWVKGLAERGFVLAPVSSMVRP
jgi:uncharacterized protein